MPQRVPTLLVLSVLVVAALAPPSAAAPHLRWHPPKLAHAQTIDVSRTNARLYLDPRRDYVVRLPRRPLRVVGGLWIVGGRDVVVRGGEIAVPRNDGGPAQRYGIFGKNQTGTLHLEGLKIHGQGLGAGIVLDQAMGATVQVENTRVDVSLPVALYPLIHPDIVQTWRGPYRLRIDRFTGSTSSKGFTFQPHQYDVQRLGRWDLRHVDLTADGSSLVLWKDDNSYALGGGHAGYWQQRQRDFWVKPGRRSWWAYPSRSAWGHVRVGRPPGGDFAPRRAVGLRYAGAGYRR